MAEYRDDDFEWDEEKSRDCYKRRGYDFHVAKLVFSGMYVTWEDSRNDYNEERSLAVGIVYNEFVTVVYTERESRKRIISSWESDDDEIREFISFYGIES